MSGVHRFSAPTAPFRTPGGRPEGVCDGTIQQLFNPRSGISGRNFNVFSSALQKLKSDAGKADTTVVSVSVQGSSPRVPRPFAQAAESRRPPS